MNLFKLAERQIIRESKEPSEILVLDYAIIIRKWLDKHSQVVADRILAGDKVYNYSGKIKTYCRA